MFRRLGYVGSIAGWFQILDILARDRAARGDQRPEPLLDGRRLMAAGVAPGPRLGWLLRKVRARQLAGDLTSSADALSWLGLEPAAS